MPRHSDVSRLRPGDIIHASVTRADKYQRIGLEVKAQPGRKKDTIRVFVTNVTGLCTNVPIQVGDEIVNLNDIDLGEYESFTDIRNVIDTEPTVKLIVRRCDTEVLEVDKENSHNEEASDTSCSRPKLLEYGNSADSSSEGYDDFDRIDNDDFLAKQSYDGSSVLSNMSHSVRAGSAAKLQNIAANSSSKKLDGQTVFVMHESKKNPGHFECEFEDGSRIELNGSQHLTPISEQDEAFFQPYVPGSTRSICNLIEPGDVMKIRGLKQQAKMNGTMVEVLRPAAEHSGRWECVLCDDHERVIAVMSENLRHIL